MNRDTFMLLAVAGALAFAFGIGATEAGIDEEGGTDGPWFWVLYGVTFLPATVALTAWIRSWPSRDRKGLAAESLNMIGSAFLGALVFASALALFVVGVFLPFLFGFGDRELDRFGAAGEWDWQAMLLILFLIYAGFAGSLIGSAVGLFAWLSRFAPRVAEIAQQVPWPWRIGLGVPLLLGIVLAVSAGISWVSGGYERPDTLEAGRLDEFAEGTPVLFEEDDVWIVRLSARDFLALYDRGRESGCPLQWRREFEFMDHPGWFVDACTGSAYDLTGRCSSPACRGATLDNFPVAVIGGNVVVDLRELIRGSAPAPVPGAAPAPASPAIVPVTPAIEPVTTPHE